METPTKKLALSKAELIEFGFATSLPTLWREIRRGNFPEPDFRAGREARWVTETLVSRIRELQPNGRKRRA